MLEFLPHQLSNYEYLKQNNGGAVFASPRSGKTLPVVRFIADRERLPVLIICPSTVMASWYGALIEDGVHSSNITIVHDKRRTLKQLRNFILKPTDYFIVNYEKLKTLDIIEYRKYVSRLFNLTNWKSIVIDESYKLASFTTDVSKYVMSVPYDDKQARIVLTGTPICESPLDVVQSYIFLDGEFFGYSNPSAYRNAYYNQYGFKWSAKSALHTAKVKAFIKRNSFQVALSDLGLGAEITKSMEVLELSDYQKELYNWVALTNLYTVNGEIREMLAPIRVMFWQKISSGIHPITNEIIDVRKADHIADVYDGTKESILVLTRFTKIIPAILDVFKSRNITAEIITGDTLIEDRELIRSRFQNSETAIVIAQVDTVARGLDFSKLSKIYYYNNTYSYETRSQSELRGQNVKRDDFYEVIDLCFNGSIDIDIRKRLNNKHTNVKDYIKQIDIELRNKWKILKR